jgi:hypothetical protein
MGDGEESEESPGKDDEDDPGTTERNDQVRGKTRHRGPEGECDVMQGKVDWSCEVLRACEDEEMEMGDTMKR